jgi:hypothetical protein
VLLSCGKFIRTDQSRYQQGFRRIFTIKRGASFSAAAVPRVENQSCLRKTGRSFSHNAPGTRQAAVDSLHSIDFPEDKTASFLLTLKMKGVKQGRSLTASEVFPVGAASGAQAKSLSASQDDGGKAGKGL